MSPPIGGHQRAFLGTAGELLVRKEASVPVAMFWRRECQYQPTNVV